MVTNAVLAEVRACGGSQNGPPADRARPFIKQTGILSQVRECLFVLDFGPPLQRNQPRGLASTPSRGGPVANTPCAASGQDEHGRCI